MANQHQLPVFKFHPNASWEDLERAIADDHQLQADAAANLGSDSRNLLKQMITRQRKHLYYWNPALRQRLISHLEAQGFSHDGNVPRNFRRTKIRAVPKKRQDLKRLRKAIEELGDPPSFMPRNDTLCVNVEYWEEVLEAVSECGFEAYRKA